MFDPKEHQETITIIGAGNIGSMVAYGLTKLGLYSILVYDFDKVEEHNLASQFYGIRDIGKLKTECLKKHIEEFTGIEIETDDKFIDQTVYGILIIAVDSMPERERISKVINKQTLQTKQIIDGRMGGNTIEVYTVKTPSEYKKTLVKDVVSEPCSARYISYTSLICAGIITDQVKRYLCNEEITPNVLFDADTFRIIS